MKYVALLRAVNVGGSGKLPMKDLSALCVKLGFKGVRTYIQSGNVIFESFSSEDSIRKKMEKALSLKLGKETFVHLRTAAQLETILKSNPFPKADRAKVGVYFQSQPVTQTLLKEMKTPGKEKVRQGKRELYLYFPDGMGRSKLKLPKTNGTVRNLNTITKLAEMMRASD